MFSWIYKVRFSSTAYLQFLHQQRCHDERFILVNLATREWILLLGHVVV